ncbi:MAG: biotin--[acetyl-CoA-carboxylase] ligase [Bacteroidetes bacterium]|nr:biotin--[acetyl-CoA-carboxylase] ligase [Bacteroidota bacterium]
MDIIGSQVMSLQVTDSTNSWLLQQCQRKDMPEGTLVVAEHQRQGRGQQGNTWQAPAGQNLTCSVLLKPHHLPPKQAFLLNKMSALAVRDVLADAAPEARVQVKWPNDVMINGLKAAGILIENIIQGNALTESVVGMGLNLNWHPAELPTTSLAAHTGGRVSIATVLDALVHKLNAYYLLLQTQRYHVLDEYYHLHLYLRQRPHIFTVQGAPLPGVIQGVDADGQLLVQTEAGLRAFQLKEITF